MAEHTHRIYVDAAASTPLRAEALAAMGPHLTVRGESGNPSGHYTSARKASEALERAREAVAGVLGALPEEVIFCSGGTESVNAAIKGVAFAQREAGVGAHIVTTAVEHHAVLYSAQWLERFGFEVELLPVDAQGRVDPSEVASAVRADTVLVSVMYANNEVGTVQPLREVVAAVREREAELAGEGGDGARPSLGGTPHPNPPPQGGRGQTETPHPSASLGPAPGGLPQGARGVRRIPVHTDAVQAATALSLEVDALGVDLLSLSGHKFGGPAGTGVLYVRRGTPYLELLSGGGQERQRRSGTENVAGAVGLATALVLAQQERAEFAARTSMLRERLLSGLVAGCPEARVNGPQGAGEWLPHVLHVCFDGVEGEAVVDALDRMGVEASAGAACTSATWEPSHVLLAMEVPLELAIGSLRLTLWPDLTEADIDRVVACVPRAVAEAREALTPAPLPTRWGEG